MTNDELLAAATRAATKAAKVAADATAEAAKVRHRQRVLARAVIALGVAWLVLLLLVSAILIYLVPTAARNAQILREIQRVTGPAGQAASGARTAIAICELKNENAALHGRGAAPGCSPEELAVLAEAAAR